MKDFFGTRNGVLENVVEVCSMSFAFRASLLLFALSLGLMKPAMAQVQPTAEPAVRALAAALETATSEEEQDRLLVQEQNLVNSSLLAALKEKTDFLLQKSDFAPAQKLLQLAARIAERIEDRRGLADAMTGLGFIHMGQNRAAQALDYLQKSLAIYEVAGDKKGTERALNYIGATQRLQSRFDEALESFNRALPISEEIGDRIQTAVILSNIGIVYRSRGDYQLAMEFYQKSRAISEGLTDKRALKNVLNSIGNVYQAQGSYELALEFYRKSLAICEELNDKDGMQVVLYAIGAVYNFQGRYAEALAYFQKSLKINEELGSAGMRGIGFNLHSIGMLYSRQGRYDQALEYYGKSLKIREELNDKFGTGQTENNIGVVYKSQGLYEQAMEWFQKSLKLAEGMAVKGDIAGSLSNIGDIHRRQGRYDLALEYLQKSLRLREEMGDRRGICATLRDLGLLYQDKGDYTALLEVSRRAAGLAEDIHAPEELWAAQEGIGRALRALGEHAQARQSFLDAINTVESLRHQVAGDAQQQQSFLENKLSPWLSMIGLLVSQNEPAEALNFAERSKARVLLDVLQGGRASPGKSLSLQEQQTEKDKRLHLVELNLQLGGEMRRDRPSASRVEKLKADIARARLEYEALETSVYATHPELQVHRGEAAIITPEELTALLPDAGSALLEYVVTDAVTYLFAVTRAQSKSSIEVKVFTVPVKQTELARLTENFRQQLEGRDLGFRSSALKLYDLLLRPAQAQLKGKRNLVIVPDDKLWDLPFQALLAGDRYLIENTAVSYTPSLTVLREMSKQRKKRETDAGASTLLAFGNPGPKPEALPQAEQEVNTLRQVYGAAHSKVYVGAEASEDRAKAEAGQASVLHFATHATLDNAAPMYSHLSLAQGDKNEDGVLEAWELMQLDLKAELAVLSACETARGRFGAGEGMIGLTWALFVAGVPTTVVSQWQVEAAGTRDLMVSFHRALNARHEARTEALRQAALKLMRNPETSHPFYWAGFVLVGDGR
ncbi:MAG TPA: CHAT domain-containing protein [Terriglobia bacterium]|nr:CHAT domain-containing protein [Terriglobia bacterium]